jgi:hypothetical protein
VHDAQVQSGLAQVVAVVDPVQLSSQVQVVQVQFGLLQVRSAMVDSLVLDGRTSWTTALYPP